MTYDSTLVGVGVVVLLALLIVLFKRIKKYKHEQALFRQSQMGYPNPPPLRSPIPNEPYPILHLPNYAYTGSMRDTVITIDGKLFVFCPHYPRTLHKFYFSLLRKKSFFRFH
ncbi:hypothetical protein GCK32_014814 [Trichostrongylus colubriformis]|uniref:Uncharacterized protein n=1 Tax=Trichostrongylus colubriformis TaxID=6319 RepID=A0AAN8EWE8_TRICO